LLTLICVLGRHGPGDKAASEWRTAVAKSSRLFVIIDEASQSDVTELPALLRGKKILVVGDDRQVSPTAPFVTQEKIGQLATTISGAVARQKNPRRRGRSPGKPDRAFRHPGKNRAARHHYLGDMPFKSLLEPGDSIYDLMRAVFPNDRLMLKEHFRCVEPIIRFSMQFILKKCSRARMMSRSRHGWRLARAILRRAIRGPLCAHRYVSAGHD
jgi:hypothetical protein